MKISQYHLLRIAFAAGAVTDAFAVLPMLFPALANLMWGIDEISGPYRFAMGYGAALMLGWTGLLVWAFQKPVERKFVSILTILVICGFIVTEIIAVLYGWVTIGRMIPSWVMQLILLVLFGFSNISAKQ
jgi:hypothetical protein